MRRPHHESGFSLIELIAAIAIFSMISVFTMQITGAADETSTRAQVSRELRYLAEYKYEQIKVFEEEYDDILEDDFDELEDERFKGYRWTLDIRDVVVFGTSTVDEAEYYFEDPNDDDDDDDDATPTAPAQAGTNAAPEELRELTLRVTAPEDDGAGGDTIEIKFLLPKVR